MAEGSLGDTEGIPRLPYPDLTEALQARILADQKAEKVDQGPCNRGDPDEGGRVEALEARIATLEEAVAKAEALADQLCVPKTQIRTYW